MLRYNVLEPMSSERYQLAVANSTVELVQGDITRQATDAIVNAANSSLLGGGGVDGAIHRAAGPELLAETRTLGGCETGNARISGGYRLPARHVIHAVGPIYRPGDPNVPRLLASCYRRSLEIADDHGLTSVAFPAISTGIYGYPMHEAAEIALNTTLTYLSGSKTGVQLVRFVLFTADALQAFAEVSQRLVHERQDVRLMR